MKSRATRGNAGAAASPILVMEAASSPTVGNTFESMFGGASSHANAVAQTSGNQLSDRQETARFSAFVPENSHPVTGCEPVIRDGVAAQLAAAKVRIAELEFALREAGEIASHDPLTGVLNRRGMGEAFSREVARAQRSRQPLTLALIDLDDFKRVNDGFGHAVGDAALVQLTRVIRQTLRPTDICSRLGGEEFVVIMPGSDRAAATRALDRLQAAILMQPVSGTSVTLSFSAGVVLVQHGESLDQALVRADRAVYRAKAAGKRRTVSS